MPITPTSRSRRRRAVVALAAALALPLVSAGAAGAAPEASGPPVSPGAPAGVEPGAGVPPAGVDDAGAPVAPIEVVLTQPDGGAVVALPHGDGARSWYTTLDGHAVAQAPDGTWTYAVGTDGAGQLRPGAVRPDLAPPPAGVRTGLRPTADQVLPAEAGPAPDAAPPPDEPVVGAPGIQHQGAAPTLVVLASFTDVAGTTPASYWRDQFFGTTGSVADFYDEVSYGALDLVPAQETHGTAGDGIVGWVPLGFPHPNPQNTDYTASRQTVAAALVAADPYVDYAAYDRNADGVIRPEELHLTVIMAGYETAWGGAAAVCGKSVWGHRSTTYTATPTLDGRQVGGWGYTTFGEIHCTTNDPPGYPATMGIMAHEIGHDLGWPDLYDTDRSSSGVGAWSLMAGGTWNNVSGQRRGTSPAHPDPFLKWLQGWVTPQQVTTSATGLTVTSAATAPDVKQLRDNPGGVDWGHGISPGTGEYFLVENRQRTGYDTGLPGCGVLIWHVDESVTQLKPNDDETHKLVDLEEADGLATLDTVRPDGFSHAGDGGDPYPGTTGNTTFGPASNPSSDLYGGAPSGVTVQVASGPCAPQMGFSVSLPGSACPPDDAYEENDARLQAAPVAVGAVVAGRVCPGDDDWFSLPVTAGRAVTVDLDFTHATGDLELALHDGTGSLVAQSTSGTDDEQVSGTPGADGTWYVRVWGFEGASAPYQLRATVPWCPPDDGYEPNDGWSTATPLPMGTEVSAVSCAGNGDLFVVEATEGRELTVDVDFVHDEGDIDVVLYDAAHDQVAASTTATDDEQIVHVPVASGQHFVWVYGYSGATNDYRLRVQDAGCPPDDALEDNDTRAQARAVADGVATDGVVCPDDDDWFRIGVSQGEQVTATLDFSHADGDLDLEVYDPSGEAVGTSLSTTDDEQVTVTAATGGQHTVRVHGYDGASAPYQLVVDTADCPADDAFEPNDGPGQATALADGVARSGRICPDDIDVYAVVAAAGQDIDVHLDLVHAVGDLDLLLVRPDGSQAGASTSSTDDEDITATATTSGVHLVVVAGYEGAAGRYTVQADLSSSVPGVPVVSGVVPGLGSVGVSWSGPVADGGSPVSGFEVQAVVGGSPSGPVVSVGVVSSASVAVAGCVPVAVRVRARNGVGAGAWSAVSSEVVPWVREGFVDVGPGAAFFDDIGWMARSCLSSGWPDGTYRPGESISRQAMAAFLWRLAGSPAPSGGGAFFEDVGPGHQFFDAIQWMGQSGVSTGSAQPGGRPLFAPDEAVSRQAMAAFLHRFDGGGAPPVVAAVFADVPAGAFFFEDIQWMGLEGISTGTPQPGGKPLYQPTDPVSRQAMAAFIHRMATR